MKGIVFTEFIEMVEAEFGFKTAQTIIEKSNLESGGAYTSIGTYNHSEMIELVSNLAIETNSNVKDLLLEYGKYLFGTFHSNYPSFFEKSTDAFDFLENVETYIHPEVRKLYPDAELPRFESSRPDDQTLILTYFSSRKMGDFARGLIEKTLVFYHTKASINQELIEKDGSIVRFTIIKTP